MVSRAVEGGCPASARAMAAAVGREGGEVVRAADEDQVGELQSPRAHNPPEYRARQEAARVPRIHRGPRAGPPAGADPQRSLHRADGPLHAQMAGAPPGAQPVAGSERDVELFSPNLWDETASVSFRELVRCLLVGRHE